MILIHGGSNSTSLGKLISLIICIAVCSACSNTEEPFAEPDSRGLYVLDESEIDDWDEGFIYYSPESSSASIYILSKVLKTERFIYINTLDNITNDGFNVSINQNGKISNIIYRNTMYNVSYQGNYIVLSSYNGITGDITVPITNHSIDARASRSSPSWWSGAEFVTNLIDIFQNGGALANGEYAKFLVALSTDQLISTLKLGAKGNVLTWIGIELANRAFFAAAKEVLYHGSIPVLSQERENNTITLKLSPNNIDATERTYVGISILVNNAKIPSYTVYDKRSNLIAVTPGISEYKFDIDFSALGHYEIRPFLISHSIIQDYDTEFVREWFVQYGELQEYCFPDIHVLSVQKKICGAISDDEVAFRIESTVFIEKPFLVDKVAIKIVNSDYELGTFSVVPSNNNEIILTAQGKIPSENFNEHGETTLIISPYAESGDDVVFGKHYEYVLSLTDMCPDDHHPHAIDLGLPSGTKWCCCNVGAVRPEAYGGYYAWGETSEKSVYNGGTYDYGSNWDGCASLGADISGTQYDVAHVRMGAPWVMPSHEQQEELMDYCTQEWTSVNGVNGILVTGPNDGQIFIPAGGFRLCAESVLAGSLGIYWSSTQHLDDSYCAYNLSLTSGDWGWYYNDRAYGFSVRAVCP